MVSQLRRQSNGPSKSAVKGRGKPTFTCLPDSSLIEPTMPQQQCKIHKMLRVRRKNPLARLASPRANKERDKATARMASNWRYLGPHRGNLASTSFVSDSQSGSFHHAPQVGWHRVTRVLPIVMTRERCVKPLDLDGCRRSICIYCLI
jgi:hypothetical protein